MSIRFQATFSPKKLYNALGFAREHARAVARSVAPRVVRPMPRAGVVRVKRKLKAV